MMQFLNAQNPSSKAVTIVDQSFSFENLISKVDQMSDVFTKLPNGVIILEAKHSFSFIIQLLSALKMSKPVLILPPHLSPEKQKSILTQIKSQIFINQKGALISHCHHDKAVWHHPQTALILLTSGSQGMPKLVQLSAANIHANCQAVIQSLRFEGVKDQLLFLPLHYSFGLLGQLLPALMTGVHTHLVNDFSMIHGVLQQGIMPSMWSGVPSHLQVLSKLIPALSNSPPQITHIISAGERFPLPLRKQLKKLFPNALIFNNYGLTEASPRILTLNSLDDAFLSDAVGYPVGDWQLTTSSDGELMAKGTQVMLGYLGSEESEQKVHHGWLHTGDLGEIKPNGLVFIEGRFDRGVNLNGEKVNLDAIELKLQQTNMELYASIKELEHSKLQLIIMVEQKNLTPSKDFLNQKIIDALQPWPHGFKIVSVDSFPRTNRGKINRFELEKMIAKEH